MSNLLVMKTSDLGWRYEIMSPVAERRSKHKEMRNSAGNSGKRRGKPVGVLFEANAKGSG
jgi:hypothetical protein